MYINMLSLWLFSSPQLDENIFHLFWHGQRLSGFSGWFSAFPHDHGMFFML